MIPWRPVLVAVGISVGFTTAIAILCAANGWTVQSPVWALLAPVAMWAPALGRFVACRTVDRGFTSTLPLRRSPVPGVSMGLLPLAIPLGVYGAAYAVAWIAGMAHWNPGEGRWTSGSQIAANLVVNLSILAVYGTFTAMGEELGWRGYLQPRLDTAGVRGSLIVVWLAQLAYHAPLAMGAGYTQDNGPFPGFGPFAIADLPVTLIFAWLAYRAASLWPAVLFHSFHNTISQWLFPKLFSSSVAGLWLGETGLLPAAGYVVVGAAVFWRLRRRGSWQALSRAALRHGESRNDQGTASR